MYSANNYRGPEYAQIPSRGQMMPVSELGPQVIQFNFFGQDATFPNILSGLNFPNESGSDRDSDYDFGAYLGQDSQGYPYNCTLKASNFVRDSNNNCSDDDPDSLHAQRQFVPQRNQRKGNNEMYQKASLTRGTNSNLPSHKSQNATTDSRDPNVCSGFHRKPVEESFNGHDNGGRLEPDERQRLYELHEKNSSHLQPLRPSGRACGGHLVNFNHDNSKKTSDHTSSSDDTGVTIDQEKFVKPVATQPIAASKNATTQPEDKKKLVAKYDLTNCRYCRVAKQPYDHPLYNKDREVVCAKLSQYKCPFCNATGKQAHTLKYCKENPILRGELAAIKKLGKGKAPEEHRDEAFRLKKRKLKCRYCRKLGLDFEHIFKDAEGVACPVLFKVFCELCGATGKDAHSKDYCKQGKGENLQDAGVAISTLEILIPEICNFNEPSAGGTTTAEVLNSTKRIFIPDEPVDDLASQRSFQELHNSSTVLSSTLCVTEDKETPEPTLEIVDESCRLNSLKPVSEALRNLDALVHVKSVLDIPNVSEALVTAEIFETLEHSLTKRAAMEVSSAAVEEKPSALEEAMEEKPSALEEAVEEKPSALEEAVEEKKPSALEEAVEEKKPSAFTLTHPFGRIET